MHVEEVINPRFQPQYNDSNCMIWGISNIFCFIFSMVFTRGFGFGASGKDRLGLSDHSIYEFIATKVIAACWSSILEVFGFIKTAMIKLFDKQL